MTPKGIFIVAGHGESENGQFDPGAIAPDGTTEREIVVTVAKILQEKIEKNGIAIFGVGISENLSLANKIKLINKICGNQFDYKNSLLISLHCNSADQSASGTETWHYQNSQICQDFAASVSACIAEKLEIKDRGAKDESTNRYGKLGIVHDTMPLAILAELAFLSNNSDREKLKNYPEKFADAIIAGIEKYTGFEFQKNQNSDEIEKAITLISESWKLNDLAVEFSKKAQEKMHQANEILRKIS